ncbi:MAG: TldD/PmbA family protein [candidate division WOR-3 bacterium]
MLKKEKLLDFASTIVKMSDADMTTVSVVGNKESLTRFSNNEITQNVDSTKYSFTIRTVYDGKVGIVSGTSIDGKNIKKFLEKAKEISKNQTHKKEILPLPSKMEYTLKKSFDKKTEELSPDERAKYVKEAVKICIKEKLNGAGIFSNGASSFVIVNSNGLEAHFENSNVTFSITAQGKNSSGWAEQNELSVKNIDVIKNTKIAVEKAKKSKNPKDIKPGKYTVILEPAAVADLISFLSYTTFNGLMVAEGRSFLSGKIGQKVACDMVTLYDDPYFEGIGGIPFDFEGFPRQKLTLLENGVFKDVPTDRKVAKMLNLENNGHSLGADDEYGPLPLNLYLKEGNSNLDEMIKTTKTGILVTQFHYVNMLNPMTTTITGMTRNGIFLVEDGKVKDGLKNMRFTQSIMEALSNVLMIGDKCIVQSGGFGGGFAVPAMKIKDFTFTSKTEF